jgi:hypothetical protein
MDDNIATVHHDPALAGLALPPTSLAVAVADGFQGRLGQRVEHAVAGTGTQHKIIGEGGDVFEVEEKNILPLLIFQ